MPKAYLEPQEVAQLEEAAEYLRDKLLIRLLSGLVVVSPKHWVLR